MVLDKLVQEEQRLMNVPFELLAAELAALEKSFFLTEKGERAVSAVLGNYNIDYHAIVSEIFAEIGARQANQDDFLVMFMAQLQRDDLRGYESLFRHLDSDEVVERIKKAVRYNGIGFTAMYYAFGIKLKEDAKRLGILRQEGKTVSLT